MKILINIPPIEKGKDRNISIEILEEENGTRTIKEVTAQSQKKKVKTEPEQELTAFDKVKLLFLNKEQPLPLELAPKKKTNETKEKALFTFLDKLTSRDYVYPKEFVDEISNIIGKKLVIKEDTESDDIFDLGLNDDVKEESQEDPDDDDFQNTLDDLLK